MGRKYLGGYLEAARRWRQRHPDRRRAQAKKLMDRNRVYIRQQKMKPCADCHIQYSPWVMEFDHLSNKQFTLSDISASYSLSRIELEISKCEVVCANCHRERTYQRRQQKIPQGVLS